MSFPALALLAALVLADSPGGAGEGPGIKVLVGTVGVSAAPLDCKLIRADLPGCILLDCRPPDALLADGFEAVCRG